MFTIRGEEGFHCYSLASQSTCIDMRVCTYAYPIIASIANPVKFDAPTDDQTSRQLLALLNEPDENAVYVSAKSRILLACALSWG